MNPIWQTTLRNSNFTSRDIRNHQVGMKNCQTKVGAEENDQTQAKNPLTLNRNNPINGGRTDRNSSYKYLRGLGNQKEKEIVPIFLAHTIVDPRAVVIISANTFLTFMAVLGSIGLIYSTNTAISAIPTIFFICFGRPKLMELAIEINRVFAFNYLIIGPIHNYLHINTNCLASTGNILILTLRFDLYFIGVLWFHYDLINYQVAGLA